MAQTQIQKLPEFQGKSGPGVATLKVPLGLTIDKIFLAYGGADALDNLGRVEVVINGRVIQTFTDVKHLRESNNMFLGDTANSNNSAILHFDQEWLRQLNDVKAFGFGTTNIDTFHIRLTLGASWSGVNTLEASAQVSAPRPLGLVQIIRTFNRNDSEGLKEISDIPKTARIAQIVFRTPQVKDCTVKFTQGSVANAEIYNATAALEKVLRKEALPFARGADTNFTIDFMGDGAINGSQDMSEASDFRLNPTLLAATGNYQMVVYYFGELGSV